MKKPEPDTPKQLSVVHVCQHCGVETLHDDVNGDAAVTGVVRCSTCGFEGPLQVSISEQPTEPTEEER